MLLNPSILALIIVSSVVAGMMLIAAHFSIRVLRNWDISSGSELQLNLERRTYLISTIVAFSFLAELVSLLLFIYNAEQMSSQFVGAMCATGVLNINAYGWPTLYLKIAIFFSGAAWLMLNRVDNKAFDYPLVQEKYLLLLLIVPMILAEVVIQTRFFLEMDPDIITSCCGALFTPEGEGVAAELSGVAPATALWLLIASAGLVILSGSCYLLQQKGGVIYAGSNLLAFFIALVAIVSCVALYIYEHPHHHCPFCILKSGHDFMGYWLYIPLFSATALALGVGVISPFQKIPSLNEIIPADSHRYILLSMLMMLIFYLVAAYAIVGSNLTMLGTWW